MLIVVWNVDVLFKIYVNIGFVGQKYILNVWLEFLVIKLLLFEIIVWLNYMMEYKNGLFIEIIYYEGYQFDLLFWEK